MSKSSLGISTHGIRICPSLMKKRMREDWLFWTYWLLEVGALSLHLCIESLLLVVCIPIMSLSCPVLIKWDWYTHFYTVRLLYAVLGRGTFHEEVCFLRQTLLKNAYPGYFIDKCVKCFLDKIFIAKKVFLTVPQKELRLCLPFLGKHSPELKPRLQKYVHKYFSSVQD